MTDRPIIFSAAMVQAILAGRKKQTRRLSGLDDVNERPNDWTLHSVRPLGYMAKPSAQGKFGATFESRHITAGTLTICPQRLPYRPGDRLWVKEAWRSCVSLDHLKPSEIGERASEGGYRAPWGPVFYEADGAVAMWPDCAFTDTVGRYRNARFMPRWASRRTLHVTDVRVQRLRDLSENDAIAEGVSQHLEPEGNEVRIETYVQSFGRLWNSLHGPDAWSANPWVCAVSFRTDRKNIDEAEE